EADRAAEDAPVGGREHPGGKRRSIERAESDRARERSAVQRPLEAERPRPAAELSRERQGPAAIGGARAGESPVRVAGADGERAARKSTAPSAPANVTPEIVAPGGRKLTPVERQ